MAFWVKFACCCYEICGCVLLNRAASRLGELLLCCESVLTRSQFKVASAHSRHNISCKNKLNFFTLFSASPPDLCASVQVRCESGRVGATCTPDFSRFSADLLGYNELYPDPSANHCVTRCSVHVSPRSSSLNAD